MEKLMLWGKNSVLDAINSKLPIEVIYVNSVKSSQLITNQTKTRVIVEDNSFFNSITSENHQGIIAVLKDFPIYDLEILKKDKPQNILILDHIQDPHNLGAIMRSANVFGIKHIILTKERSVGITSTVLKISSGGFINMKIIKVNNLVASLKKLKSMGYWIYASELNKEAVSFDTIDYNKPAALIIGNESSGVSKPVLNESDVKIYIPQKGTVQSLNASVAAGLLLYKLTKE